MANPLRRLYDWVLHWAETPYGTLAMAVTNVCNMEPGRSMRKPHVTEALDTASLYRDIFENN